jgi:hypothetical protein
MKIGTMLATTAFVFASFPLLAQQPPPSEQPDSPVPQQIPHGMAPAPSNPSTAVPESAPAVPETAAIPMSPVNGELVSKLDSKTAKTGDSVVVQTQASVKTDDGTEIPKGSKLIGQVVSVRPSEAGENSQVVLQFDHAELKSGKNMAIHSQIQSIAPAGGDTSSAPASSEAMSAPPAAPATAPGASGSNGSMGNRTPSGAPQEAVAGSGAPVAGTIVAKNGNIAISTTSIPGVLLANNAPGQQDPRMAKASSILLGAKKDIQLDGGTQMVLGVSAAGGAAQ